MIVQLGNLKLIGHQYLEKLNISIIKRVFFRYFSIVLHTY
jgi:hypothetical protein